MKIAVCGAGLFGCTSAIYLARRGHEVHLFETKDDILKGATGCSFYRLHRGYHYPRSPETGREGRAAEASFRSEFDECVIEGDQAFYVVPECSENHVTPDSFESFLYKEGLPYARVQDDRFIGETFSAQENRIHLGRLKDLLKSKLKEAKVNVFLNTPFDVKTKEFYDKIVVAAYANTNDVMRDLNCEVERYKFQVVERPTVLLPYSLRKLSVVVVDGPFGCIDPIDDKAFSIVGHVRKTVLHESVGEGSLAKYLRSRCGDESFKCSGNSCIKSVKEELKKYIPAIDNLQYVESHYVVRAVLAGVEETDERLTHVKEMNNGKVVRVFSGKLGTAVDAAKRVVDIVERS